MSQTELAKRIGKTLKAVNELLSDSADIAITPETALQLEYALGLPARFWLNREQTYREILARQHEHERLQHDVSWLDGIPTHELQNRGLLPITHHGSDLMREALSFFRVASVKCWQRIWATTEITYRMPSSYGSGKTLGFLAAWLRCGEIVFECNHYAAYNHDAFSRILPQLRQFTNERAATFIPKMIDLCAKAGVALVFVPAFAEMRVCGAARWLHNGQHPIIQLSLHGQSDDAFWVTLFHEAYHILKHAKRTIYVDDKDLDGARIEEEANRFAWNLLIPEDDYKLFVAGQRKLNLESIEQFARKINLSPGIVIGRLQYNGLLHPTRHNNLKRRFVFSDSGTIIDEIAADDDTSIARKVIPLSSSHKRIRRIDSSLSMRKSMNKSMKSQSPIALVHWSDPKAEYDELGEIKLLLEATLFGGDLLAQAKRVPEIAELRISNSSLNAMRRELTCFLRRHANLQLLYFSCHGNEDGFSFDERGDPTIPYSEFGEMLNSALSRHDCVHIVFGSCLAMASSICIEQYMPRSIYAVSGFTGCPKATDVAALQASIIQDDVALFEELSNASEIANRSEIVDRKIQEVRFKWQTIINQRKEDPKREIRSQSGVAVVTANRDEKGENWNRRILLLNNS